MAEGPKGLRPSYGKYAIQYIFCVSLAWPPKQTEPLFTGGICPQKTPFSYSAAYL
jgi:hypothetical protein